MQSINPFFYGFPDGELSNLIRYIIKQSSLKNDFEHDYELSSQFENDVKIKILNFAESNNLAIPMPYYKTRYKRAIEFIALEDEKYPNNDAHSYFGPVDSIQDLCDSVCDWLDKKGTNGFDDLIVNLLNFYVFAFYYYGSVDCDFPGKYGTSFFNLLDAVQRHHKEEKKAKLANGIRIAVIGSRFFDGIELVSTYLDENIIMHNNLTLISCGSGSVYNVTKDYSNTNKIKFLDLKVKWRLYGRESRPIRNRELIEMADRIIVFWDGECKDTRSIITDAKRQGKDCQALVFDNGILREQAIIVHIVTGFI